MKDLRVDTNKLAWRKSPFEGVEWKKISFEADEGKSWVMLKFEPGASYGQHLHPAGEEYFVLEGSIQDAGETWHAGAFIRHASGSVHTPSSEGGCLLLVAAEKPIELVE